MRILVVDDELVSREKMKVIMAPLGECLAVDRGSAAVQAFQKAWADLAPFDLICLDLNMPGMNGLEVLAAIRNLEADMKLSPEARVRIIMVTGRSDVQSVRSSLQAGCDDYLVKPFDQKSLFKKVFSLFDRFPEGPVQD